MRFSCSDQVLIIAAGITLIETLKAADILQGRCIGVRVMDLFTIKPIDQATIIYNAQACEGRILTVEDHYPEGGIGKINCFIMVVVSSTLPLVEHSSRRDTTTLNIIIYMFFS